MGTRLKTTQNTASGSVRDATSTNDRTVIDGCPAEALIENPLSPGGPAEPRNSASPPQRRELARQALQLLEFAALAQG
jgi:hypothetical protein